MKDLRIWLSPPHLGKGEKEYVMKAFDTNWIAPLGPNVDGFESDLKKFTGAGHVAALSSGTAAIHLGLMLLGVGTGDVVLCQSLTFSASVNPVSYLGGVPVFIDSEPDTWNISPAQLEKAVRACIEGKLPGVDGARKPKAILPVHLYGMPAKMDEILDIGARYGIPVLEDAAEAMGSRLGDKPCGSMGRVGVLSFNGNKIITTSGGGALLSDDAELVQRARFLATQARDDAPHYQHSVIGYNYRMSNVLAGIGRGQMEVLEERIEQRRMNNRLYREMLSHVDGISFQEEPAGHYSNFWLTAILIDSHKTGVTSGDVRLALEKENIESRPIWKPMHMQPVFRGLPFYGTGVSEKLFLDGLCLPSGSNMSEGDFERIRRVLSELFNI